MKDINGIGTKQKGFGIPAVLLYFWLYLVKIPVYLVSYKIEFIPVINYHKLNTREISVFR